MENGVATINVEKAAEFINTTYKFKTNLTMENRRNAYFHITIHHLTLKVFIFNCDVANAAIVANYSSLCVLIQKNYSEISGFPEATKLLELFNRKSELIAMIKQTMLIPQKRRLMMMSMLMNQQQTFMFSMFGKEKTKQNELKLPKNSRNTFVIRFFEKKLKAHVFKISSTKSENETSVIYFQIVASGTVTTVRISTAVQSIVRNDFSFFILFYFHFLSCLSSFYFYCLFFYFFIVDFCLLFTNESQFVNFLTNYHFGCKSIISVNSTFSFFFVFLFLFVHF